MVLIIPSKIFQIGLQNKSFTQFSKISKTRWDIFLHWPVYVGIFIIFYLSGMSIIVKGIHVKGLFGANVFTFLHCMYYNVCIVQIKFINQSIVTYTYVFYPDLFDCMTWIRPITCISKNCNVIENMKAQMDLVYRYKLLCSF